MHTDLRSPHQALWGTLVAARHPSGPASSPLGQPAAAHWQRSRGAGRLVGIGAAALAGIAVFGSQFGIAHHYGAQAEAAQLAQRAAQQRLASRQAVEPAAAKEVLRAPQDKPVTRRG